jgi:hypothetical protein
LYFIYYYFFHLFIFYCFFLYFFVFFLLFFFYFIFIFIFIFFLGGGREERVDDMMNIWMRGMKDDGDDDDRDCSLATLDISEARW